MTILRLRTQVGRIIFWIEIFSTKNSHVLSRDLIYRQSRSLIDGKTSVELPTDFLTLIPLHSARYFLPHCTYFSQFAKMTTPSLQHNSTSGRSPPPEDPSLPSIPESNGGQEQPRRRGSFSFLRRTKSGTQLSTKRTVSGGKLTKKQKAIAREQKMAQEPTPQQPPMIPAIPRPTQLQTFGGENAMLDSMNLVSDRTRGNQHNVSPRSLGTSGSAMYSNVPIPPIPGNSKERGRHVDPYARTESMTNRGRYSYASSAISTINSPRRVRRRKDPTPFK